MQANRAHQLRLRLLLRRHRLHPRRRPNRRRSLRQNRRLMLVLSYHLHSLNNMPKGKGNVENQEQEVLAQKTRRRYHVISISLRNHVRMEKIALTVMIRRFLTPTRLGKAKVVERLQEVLHRQTRQRRLTSHVGIGEKGTVVMVTNATNDMIHICSRRHPMLMRNRLRRPQLQL